jgi:hypothetical protein
LLVVVRFLTMSFGSLQNTLNGAFYNPEYRSSMADVLPNTLMSPHLFKKVAVPGICVD